MRMEKKSWLRISLNINLTYFENNNFRAKNLLRSERATDDLI